ncbi:MAG: glycosyltransferase family 4 protein, partial [Armatimonadota bacterium]|nr:glycosyltransferase family 4 protein [Armatimonadota bacterium]
QSAKSLGLADKVIFAGFRDDVNNAINAMDIVTVPSTWNEPCSAVVQQGMALSKPVIGTLAGGTPEMIVDGETGLLVPPSDAPALAEAIAALAGDAFRRKRLGAAGRERALALFSLRVMTDKIEALYRREYENARGANALGKAVAPQTPL